MPGVSQAAVDKVAQLHHDSYMHKTQVEESPFINREDITLLVRNFNVAMPKAIQRNNLNVSKTPLALICTKWKL